MGSSKVVIFLKKYFWIGGLVIALLVASYFRFFCFTEVREFTAKDGGRDILVAKHLAQMGDSWLVAPGSSSDIMVNSPVYYWILAVGYFFFPSVLGMKFVFVLFGTGAVVLCFLLIRDLTNNLFGFLASLLVASQYLFVNSSVTIFQPHLLPFFIFLGLFLLFKGIKTKRLFLSYFALVPFLIGGLVHTSALLILPSVFLVLGSELFFSGKTKKEKMIYVLFSVICLLSAFLLFFVANTTSPFNLLSTIFRHLVSEKKETESPFWNRYFLPFKVFFYIDDNLAKVATGCAFIISLIVVVLKKKKILFYVFSFWLGFLLILLTPVDVLYDHYFYSLYVLITIFLFFFPFQIFPKKSIFTAVIFVIISLLFLHHFVPLTKDWNTYNYPSQELNQRITQEILKDSQREKKIIETIYVDQVEDTAQQYAPFYEWFAGSFWYNLEEITGTKRIEAVPVTKASNNIQTLYQLSTSQPYSTYSVCIFTQKTEQILELCKEKVNEYQASLKTEKPIIVTEIQVDDINQALVFRLDR